MVYFMKTKALSLSLQHALSSGRPFSHFDLGLSPETLNDLESLAVNEAGEYDNFGNLSSLETDITRFLENLGNVPELAASASSHINGLVLESLEAFEAEAAWVTLRASLPTDEFNVPRWHVDGYYYGSDEGDQHKVVFTLKGASTPIADLPENIRTDFNALSKVCRDDTPEQRRILAALVEDHFVTSAARGQGSVFVVGPDHAAIHSEPPIHTARLFFSVMPGTSAQIEELRRDWEAPITTYQDKASFNL